ncbi:MAG: T9SS type A sorting domain-containing protein [Lewinellaceae bacterium]|nr:T9SS type A sorting domain-containing protein [Lewinellaceae bacterium]
MPDADPGGLFLFAADGFGGGVFFLTESSASTFEPARVEHPFIAYQIEGRRFMARLGETVYSHPHKLYDEIGASTGRKYTVSSSNTVEKSIGKWLSHGLGLRIVSEVLIAFAFDNVQVTDIGGIEFDILVSSNQEGVKFAATDVYITYNTEAFGENVVANESIEVTKETVIENSIYELEAADETEEIVRVSVDAALDPDEYYPLSPIPEKFVHVTLDIENLIELASISYDGFLMSHQSYFYDDEAEMLKEFDKIVVEDPIFPFLAPNISEVSPLVLTAGTGDKLTIKGNNFGTIDSTNSEKYRVKFANGDEQGFGEAYAQHQDIVSWSDSIIIVSVPSATNQQGWKNPACSGGVWVERPSFTNPNQIEQSNEKDIHIRYSAFNFRSGVNLNATTKRFAYSRQTPNGIFYTYHPNVPSKAESIFEEAVKTWCSNTSIAWRISPDNADSSIDISGADGINIVKMKPSTFFEDPNARAAVIIAGHYGGCGNVNQGALYIRDIDVVIRDDFNPFDPNYEEYRWYNRILHELGHAHGLNHSLNPSIPNFEEYIMNSSMNNIPNYAHDIQDDDREGAESCFSASSNLLSIPDCVTDSIFPIMTHDCSVLNSVDELASNYSTKLFPNPLNNNLLHVEFTASKNQIVKLSVCDLLGKKVYEDSWSIFQGENRKEIEFSNDLAKGCYILSFRTNTTIVSIKFVKI